MGLHHKDNIIDAVAAKARITKKDATTAVETVFEEILAGQEYQ